MNMSLDTLFSLAVFVVSIYALVVWVCIRLHRRLCNDIKDGKNGQ